MNQLIANDVEMTSLDIAEVTGKQHAHVMRDVRNEIKELGEEIGQSIFGESSYFNTQNKEQPCYSFGKDGAMQLALKYDAKTRYKVIKRIEELEGINKPKSPSELIAMMAQNNVEQERRITVVEEKQDNIVSILTLNRNDWRNKVNRIINAIAMKRGGGDYYSEIRKESYEMLEEQANCILNRRLENRKARMALAGSSKSAINKISILDVIEEDKKLVSVYIAVIKELAVKYQLNISKYNLSDESRGIVNA